jgi:outer membrane protein OmpA-like peptidoglycan-associated protein
LLTDDYDAHVASIGSAMSSVRRVPRGPPGGKPVARFDGAGERAALGSAPDDNYSAGSTMFEKLRVFLCVGAVATVAACMPQIAPQMTDTDRLPVYFDEFSANITPAAKEVIADAVQRFRKGNAHSIRIEGRASATGSPTANQYLAQTRSQVVADELAKDGLDRADFRQVWIGQSDSGDTSVAERRVDIVIER